MFTGLIEAVGTLAARRRDARGARLVLSTPWEAGELTLGESVAVNGTCLTVVAHDARRFEADVSAETLARTTLGDLPHGAAVNLERAMKLGDRLGGHLVQGHVDGVGRFVGKRQVGESWSMTFEVPEALLDTIVEKGSITIDGISLTVATLADPRVTIAVVPHTMKATNLHALRPGASVNLETDLIGKYVQRLVQRGGGAAGGVTRDKLAALGLL